MPCRLPRGAGAFILAGNWKEKLLEYIDADQLPVHWGGTATDPDGDPYCRSKVSHVDGGLYLEHHCTVIFLIYA